MRNNQIPVSSFSFIGGLLLLVCLILPFNLIAQEKQIPSAKEFIEMPLDRAFPILSRLTKNEARDLITQIRQVAKGTNPEIDKLYFLISHLEEIQAVEREQSRLASLMWVYGLGLALFVGFLLILLIQQRQVIRELQRIRK